MRIIPMEKEGWSQLVILYSFVVRDGWFLGT